MASCYAQTEIGHGSDVQNLGTLATYDSKSDEFIIHTPTIDAVKCNTTSKEVSLARRSRNIG